MNLDQDRAEHAQTIDSKTDGPQEPNTEGQTNAEAGNKEDVSTAGPGDEDQQKKKRKRKQRSPSPPRPPPPKPQPTIRLDVPIPVLAPKGGLMLNIRQLAKDADQLVDNPEPHLHDDEPLSNDEEENNENTNPASAQTAKDAPQAISESTADVLGRSVGALLPRPKKRKRRRVLDRDEGYDKEDPFVDDSELHLDLVKTCGVPEREGFYVHSGELPLLQKGKRKRTTQSATPAQAAQPNPQQQPQQTSTSNAASPGAHGASGSPAPPPASSSNKPPDQLVRSCFLQSNP